MKYFLVALLALAVCVAASTVNREKRSGYLGGYGLGYAGYPYAGYGGYGYNGLGYSSVVVPYSGYYGNGYGHGYGLGYGYGNGWW